MNSILFAIMATLQPLPPSTLPKDNESSYQATMAASAKQGRVAVVFVGFDGFGRTVPPGANSCSVPSLYGYDPKCVVVCEPYQGRMVHRAALPGHASDDAIRRAVEGQVRQSAPPFGSRLRAGEVADGDLELGGLPTFLKDLVPYRSAQNTQLTGRRVSGSISPVSRSVLENKWRVPGHLDGVRGWSSRLLKSPDAAPHVGLVRQDPDDQVSAITWGRSYPDGAVFADVLRNQDGEVFEVRVAEKRGGAWERYTAYRNAGARPHGYVRPTRQQCAACHEGPERPGTAVYGGAAIPGGDTIFSEGYEVLESGRSVQGGYGTSLGK